MAAEPVQATHGVQWGGYGSLLEALGGVHDNPLLAIGSSEQTNLIRVGPWGGSQGRYGFDVMGPPPPERLVDMAFQTGRVINVFGFRYVDLAGKKHTIAPTVVGGRGKNTTIKFAPTEYVKEFVDIEGILVVKYLRIQTNLETYEINDKAESNAPETELPFRVPLPENSSIVGFFGRQGYNRGCLNSIGIYVKSATQVVPIPIGPWGGDGGTTFDISAPPLRLESMTIRAGNTVDAFGFSYVDEAGRKHNKGSYGGTGGQLTTISLTPAEYVTSISGTIGQSFGSQSKFVSGIATDWNEHR